MFGCHFVMGKEGLLGVYLSQEFSSDLVDIAGAHW